MDSAQAAFNVYAKNSLPFVVNSFMKDNPKGRKNLSRYNLTKYTISLINMIIGNIPPLLKSIIKSCDKL